MRPHKLMVVDDSMVFRNRIARLNADGTLDAGFNAGTTFSGSVRSIVLQADGKEQVLKRGDMVRVAPEVTRKFVTRESSATLLALGATPGKAYEPDKRMATT